ncbi:MAG: ribosome biogenesis GTPase Der [Rhodospirillales bacterium]|nr:ribosome biogenesis GTPase Der [Rhodospirillales bacterium]
MLPRVVIAGRANVGKSSLFNRLAGRRLALVADTPGLTRDGRETEVRLAGRAVLLADTAGLEAGPSGSLAGRMLARAEAVVRRADLVVFVIDARAGVLPRDLELAQWLRRQGRPVMAVTNKAEGRGAAGAAEGWRLGLGEPLAVSAAHGEGIDALAAAIAARLAPAGEVREAAERALRLAVVGRPNAGKSTLINRLLGEDRLLTGPEPGITRDAVTLPFTAADGTLFALIDTAGLRRRARVGRGAETLAASAAITALKRAEVVALAVDATAGIHEQDLEIGRLIAEEGRAAVVILTKWDAVPARAGVKCAIEERIAASLPQLKGVTVLPLSALTGVGMTAFLPAVAEAAEVWNRRIPTGSLNRWLTQALARHPPPIIGGRRVNLRYITEAKARPPSFVVFGSRAEAAPEEYRRYLVNGLRESFALPGTPIRLTFRNTENPFAASE